MKNILESLHELNNRKDQGISFANSSGNLKDVTTAELINHAQKFAGGLRKRGVKEGEPVILVMTDPESAIIAILGCMIAQSPPTPVYPPLNPAAISGFLKFISLLTTVQPRSGTLHSYPIVLTSSAVFNFTASNPDTFSRPTSSPTRDPLIPCVQLVELSPNKPWRV